MSLVSTIKLKVMNLTTLHQAMQRFGLERREQQSYRWYGYWDGNAASLPDGVPATELGQCDFAYGLPNKPNAYEIGVRQKTDGSYQLLWDDYNQGYGLTNAIGIDGCKLISEYEALTYTDLMTGLGYEMQEQTLADGTRKLTAVRYA
jgi:hypothetical protein